MYSRYPRSSYHTTTSPTYTLNSPTSPTSPGLPADEYRHLKNLHRRRHLEAQLSNNYKSNSTLSSSIHANSRTPFQRQGNLTQNQRAHISEVKNATRKALGANFDFTDESYNTRVVSPGERQTATRYRDPVNSQSYEGDYNSRRYKNDARYDRERYYEASTSHLPKNPYVNINIPEAPTRPAPRPPQSTIPQKNSTQRRHDSAFTINTQKDNDSIYPVYEAAANSRPTALPPQQHLVFQSKFSLDTLDEEDDESEAEAEQLEQEKVVKAAVLVKKRPRAKPRPKPKGGFWRLLCR